MELSSTNLGPKRGFTVAESVLWTYLLGPQLAAQVAERVSREETLKNTCGKFATLAKHAVAIRYSHSTATSITKYLKSPVFDKRLKLIHKGTKAAAAEAAEVAAEAEAVARVEETTVKPWVIAAPHHGLRRGHRDGLRHSHARVHDQTLGLVFEATDQDTQGRGCGPVPRRQRGDVQSRRGTPSDTAIIWPPPSRTT